MRLRRTAISLCALVAAMPAMAQDIQLDPIMVEGEGEDGFFGPSVSLDTGTVVKTGTDIVETPRAVNVVTAQQIAERGAQNVEETLQYSAGVAAGQWGLDNRSNWYKVRGFDPTTFHDGLISRYGYYNDTTPEPFMLNSVEVLRGPASGLYGSGAVGGVVNTTSKTAAQDAPNILQLQYGSHDRKQLGVDVSGDLNESGTLRYRFVGLLRDAETQVDFSKDDAFALAPSITWQPSEDTSLTVLLNHQKNDGSPLIQFASIYGTLYPGPGGRYLDDSLFVGEPGFDRFDTEQTAVTAMFEHRFNSVWSMKANARYVEGEADYRHAWWAYANYPTRYRADGTIDRTVYRADNSLETFAADVNATAQYNLGAVDMTTLIGASYARGLYDSDTGYGAQNGPIDPFAPVYTGVTPVTIIDTPANTVEEWGVYVQNRATWNDRLHLDLGLRYGSVETGQTNDSFGSATIDTDDDAWTMNAALMYRFENGLAPYVSYSESFRQEVVGSDAAGNPFKPTEGEQYEIGLKYQPVGTNMLFTVSAFDLTKSNLTEADPANPGFQVQTGEASTRGLELEAKTRIGDVTIDTAYTFLDTENVAGNTFANVPERFGSLWVNYQPSAGALRGWRIGGGVRHIGTKWDGTDTQATPSYTLYDAAIGYTRDNWDVALNVQNLTDEDHVSFCGVSACYLGEGRSVALTVSSRF
ncbi:MAG: TonB-dependent siderophore receptor [Roseovarius sp.]